MIKVVIAGVTGFIGQWLCKALIDKGITIVGIGRNEEVIRQLESYGEGCENKGKFKGIKLSFEDYPNICSLIRDRDFDCFFNLANYGVNGYDKGNYKIQLINTQIACDLINIAKILGCKRYVFIGSVDEFEVCDFPDNIYKKPTHSRIYGIAKYTAEIMGKVLAQNNLIEYVTAILPLTYGEGNSTNILPNVLIKATIEKKEIKLIEGNNLYDMIYVLEAVEGIIAVANYGKNMESYYVGHEKLLSFRNIVENINNILGGEALLVFGEYNDQGCIVDYNNINLKKLKNQTGYSCSIPLDKSIINTYNWIKKKYYPNILKNI